MKFDANEYGGDPQVAQLRIPPHSIESESSVLGGLLLDNSAWDRVGDLLVEGDFYRYEHKLVFAAVGGLINASKPADVITVFDTCPVWAKRKRWVVLPTSTPRPNNFPGRATFLL